MAMELSYYILGDITVTYTTNFITLIPIVHLSLVNNGKVLAC